MQTSLPVDVTKEKRFLGEIAPIVFRAGGVIGVAGLAATGLLATLTEDGIEHFYRAWLVSFSYFLTLSLGALFFVILQHLTHAGWSVVLRRIAEVVAGNLPLMALLALPLLSGMQHVYHWADPAVAASDELIHKKHAYLNVPFFIARMAVYFGAWTLMARFFLRNSLEQDTTGDAALTQRMEKFSAPAMVAFAITQTFASFDFLMSTDPHWFSTIYGVYFFAGSVVGFFALLPITVYSIQRTGRLTHSITAEHFHDMGKLLFAFVVFWAYIAFSQFMLIWYANLPEETGWYLRRQEWPWAGVSLLLIIGHFLIPFLALISRIPKRRRPWLVVPAIWMLAMHWADIYWLVVPNLSESSIGLGLIDLTCFLGIGGIFVAAIAHRLRRRSLLAEKDPRLVESLRFENA